MLHLREIAPLTDREKEARSRYASDSRFHHLVCQGLGELVVQDPDYQLIEQYLPDDVKALDAAIRKSELEEPQTLYSGHGNQLAVTGAIWPDANPSALVGLTYRYGGFISTSSEKAIAENFIRKTASKGQYAVLLEILLPATFQVLNMTGPTGGGEFEYLIGRQREFEIIRAEWVKVPQLANPALQLTLCPA